MRSLFDQATPVPIRAYLDRHEVRTASQQGWDTLKNGDLLTAAEAAGFDVLLTMSNLSMHRSESGRGNADIARASKPAMHQSGWEGEELHRRQNRNTAPGMHR